jgi:uncharacterized integral membrane protein
MRRSGRREQGGNPMKFVYVACIAVFAAVVLLFKVQNLETVTVSFLGASMSMAVSVLILIVYVLGMLTGGFALALLRTWVRGATAGRSAS